MKSVTDFTPGDEEVIVNRVLIQIHSELDSCFPNAKESPSQFRKTVFSDEETTQLNKVDTSRIPPPPNFIPKKTSNPSAPKSRKQKLADRVKSNPPTKLTSKPPGSLKPQALQEIKTASKEISLLEKLDSPVSSGGQMGFSDFPEFTNIDSASDYNKTDFKKYAAIGIAFILAIVILFLLIM